MATGKIRFCRITPVFMATSAGREMTLLQEEKQTFMEYITIKNANVHNLKNIDIQIPKEKLVTIVGVSGSGKSSIVYDILYKKSIHQYCRYRDLISDTLEIQTCDEIIGLSPVIGVRQNTIRQANPKSTIGTRFKILEDLKRLYLLEGTILCPHCGARAANQEVCPNCKVSLPMVSDRQLSFNSPEGMCLECQGRGHRTELHMENIIAGEEDTLYEICKRLKISVLLKSLSRFTDYYEMDPETVRFAELDRKKRNQFLYGFRNPDMAYGTYWGVIPAVESSWQKGTLLPGIASEEKCSCCQGYKLGEAGRSLKVRGLHIGEMQSLSVAELEDLLLCVRREPMHSERSGQIIERIVAQISKMTAFGLGYLSLAREIPSLSGGELHKLFLMQHLDSRKDSMIYIFDEPASGLHKLERKQIITWLEKLRDNGNSVIVVEHDRDIINASDYIIEVGPGAGQFGGKIIYSGASADFRNNKHSVLADYLYRTNPYGKRIYREADESTPSLFLENVSTNNLKHISVRIPLYRAVGIAGVSGSGKSSLIAGTLIPILKFHFGNDNNDESLGEENEIINGNEIVDKTWECVSGLQYLDGYVQADQRPIAGNCRSNLLTYLDMWTFIRKLFGAEAAKEGKGFSASYFSFNSQGACDKCKGIGFLEKRNAGLVYEEVCSECHGKRYRKEVLSVTVSDKNITDILEMSVQEAREFFHGFGRLTASLELLEKAGLGYMKLGQPLSTLSGGECQRLKLMKQLLKKRKGNVLYILDEPTAGLGEPDIARLLDVVGEIVREGNSVIVIEHNVNVLSWCDYIIELGPGSGNSGGKIIMTGSPEELKRSGQSVTGPYLPES